MQDDLIERREELLAIKRIIVAKNARIAALEADKARLIGLVKEATDGLEDIGVYGCGMLNQPAALNGAEEAWLRQRINCMEQVARATLAKIKEATDGR